MRCEPFTKKNSLCVRDGQSILLGNDSLPEGGHVAQLLFGGEIVETRRGIGQGL